MQVSMLFLLEKGIVSLITLPVGRRARTGSRKWKIYGENRSTKKSSVPITDISSKMRSLMPYIIVWRGTSLCPLIYLKSFTT